ncbi:hypothetical protein ABPG72_010467 [Tetrahymena utriculariae]
MDKKSFGQTFCSEYYGAMMKEKSQRGAMVNFYGQDSQMNYNGEECNGIQQISRKIESLGYEKIIYKIDDLDIIERPGQYVMLIFGALQMDNSDEFRFTQTFNVVQNQNGGYYIQTDILRLLI